MYYIFKIIFFSSLIMGTMISISSYSWLGAWMGLEINLLSFIPILSSKNNSYSSESSMKYFLIQAFASSIFLFSLILFFNWKNIINENMNMLINMTISSSLLMKSGTAPFHFWFPEIIEGMNWMNSMILLTWQKITPFMLISYIFNYNKLTFIISIILISSMIGSLGGLNQMSLRKLLAYSSINHMSWMLSSLIFNNMIWIIYFLIYSFNSIILILLFNKSKIFYLKQMYSIMTNNYQIKFMIVMNLFSLSGLPPFLGFLPKWIIIEKMIYINMFLTLFMIMMSLITIYFYMRIMYPSLMIINNEINFNMMNNMNYKYNKKLMFLTMMNISSLIMFSFLMNL